MTVFLRRSVPDITDGYTKGESCELAVERGYHLTYRLGGPSGSRDDVVQCTSTRSVLTGCMRVGMCREVCVKGGDRVGERVGVKKGGEGG